MRWTLYALVIVLAVVVVRAIADMQNPNDFAHDSDRREQVARAEVLVASERLRPHAFFSVGKVAEEVLSHRALGVVDDARVPLRDSLPEFLRHLTPGLRVDGLPLRPSRSFDRVLPNPSPILPAVDAPLPVAPSAALCHADSSPASLGEPKTQKGVQKGRHSIAVKLQYSPIPAGLRGRGAVWYRGGAHHPANPNPPAIPKKASPANAGRVRSSGGRI